MELSTVLEERRSVRHFNDQKLDRGIIEDILNYAILSPSAKNRQPWYFVVVENQELKEKIADMLLYSSEDPVEVTCNVIKDCSALILVFADVIDLVNDVVSVGACIENMILRARDLNVGSLWIGYILKIEEKLQREFSLNKKLIAAVALGYTDHFPSKRPRKSLAEVCEWW
mgnify:CR=1 FL=1